jgi:hypothetical protein
MRLLVNCLLGPLGDIAESYVLLCSRRLATNAKVSENKPRSTIEACGLVLNTSPSEARRLKSQSVSWPQHGGSAKPDLEPLMIFLVASAIDHGFRPPRQMSGVTWGRPLRRGTDTDDSG